MDFSGFIENLKTHEMEMKVREERETPKKRKLLLSKLLPPPLTKIHLNMEMKTLTYSLGEWAKCLKESKTKQLPKRKTSRKI